AESARRRGAPTDKLPNLLAHDPGGGGQAPRGQAVVAIYNLDRMEPLVIEQLFTVLGNRSFLVTELGTVISASVQPQIIVGIPRVRAVPKWVRQQCAVGWLQEPSINELASSTKLRVGEENRVLVDQVVEALDVDLATATRFR